MDINAIIDNLIESDVLTTGLGEFSRYHETRTEGNRRLIEMQERTLRVSQGIFNRNTALFQENRAYIEVLERSFN